MDLPAPGSPSRVEFEGPQAEPSVWHPEVLPDGSVRLHVAPPSGELPGGTIALRVEASAAVAGGRGPLALPRVRPVDGGSSTSGWVARVEPGLTLQPIRARGLAWIDPAAVPVRGASPSELADGLQARRSPPRGTDRRRWRGPGGRGRTASEARGRVETVVSVGPGRIAVRARVSIFAGDEPCRAVLIGLNRPVADPSAWRITDESTGVVLRGTPVDPARGGRR